MRPEGRKGRSLPPMPNLLTRMARSLGVTCAMGAAVISPAPGRVRPMARAAEMVLTIYSSVDQLKSTSPSHPLSIPS